MLHPLGFSTGSLAPGNVRRALTMLAPHRTTALELSALRTTELDDILSFLPSYDWSTFRYISFHAPSRFNGLTEADVIRRIHPVIQRRWPIIVHPDALTDWNAWANLGHLVCIENMDNRKPAGRTVEELLPIFDRLPDARFCFDIGHARQIDPSMKLSHDLVTAFRSRLAQVHLSVVDDNFAHQPLSAAAMQDFAPLLQALPPHVAIILETPVDELTLPSQWNLAMIS